MDNPSIEDVLKVFRKNFREIPLVPAFRNPYQTLVAVMLSARTRDETTVKIALKLFESASTPGGVARMSLEELIKAIYGVSFYKTKAKNLKQLSQDLVEKYGGNVPQTLEELTALPGIGRKTANIVLARSFGIPAIGVDTHVHRVANTLGWVKTKTPEKTEIELMKILPRELWAEINSLFVSIGQQHRSQRQLIEFLKKNNLIN
jgi:endonuclease III